MVDSEVPALVSIDPDRDRRLAVAVDERTRLVKMLSTAETCLACRGWLPVSTVQNITQIAEFLRFRIARLDREIEALAGSQN